MPKVPGFCGGTYQGRSIISDSQRCVNLYPEQSQEKNRLILIGTPGRSVFSTIGSEAIECFHYTQGRLFCATLTTLYEINSAGENVSRGSIQKPAGTGEPTPNTYVRIDDNTLELYITTGVTAWNYNLTTDTLTELSINAIYDGVFWDGYFIGWGGGQVMYFSGQYDGLTWNALNFVSAEGAPDYLQRIINSHRELVAIGTDTTEFFSHVGDPDAPLYPNRSAHLEYGINAVNSLVKLDQCLYFIGGNRDGHALGIKIAGYQAQIITPPAISQAWGSYTTITDARAYGYTEDAHSFWVIQFPTEDLTWVYDVSMGLWHERGYYDTATASWEADRPQCHVYAFGKHLTGDRETGIVYEQKLTTYTDNGDALKRMRVFPHIHNSNKRMYFPSLELHAEMGLGGTATLRYSDDGGMTYTDAGDVSMGDAGEYTNRARWDRLGSGQDRVFELSSISATKQVWIDCYVNE